METLSLLLIIWGWEHADIYKEGAGLCLVYGEQKKG